MSDVGLDGSERNGAGLEVEVGEHLGDALRLDDVADPADGNPDVCGDSDGDSCDDCSVGTDDFGPLADNLPADSSRRISGACGRPNRSATDDRRAEVDSNCCRPAVPPAARS